MTNDKVRVLHLIHTVAYGGVETAVLNWIRGLDRSKFEVFLVSFANPGATEVPFVEAAQRQGLVVGSIKWSRRKPVLRAAFDLRRFAAQWKIDIVHAHNCYADVVTAVASKLGGKSFRTISTAYVWFDFKNWKRNLIQWVDAKALRSFDCVTAHCENTRIETIKRGFRAESVRTLICGFETHRVELSSTMKQARRLQLGASDEEFVLVSVARFYPEKAHIFLLETFAQVLEKKPSARLWLVGIGPLETEIRTFVEKHGLTDRVRFLGFVVDLPPLLALADMQVHPALVEGVPLAICEGMAAGLPIVASAVGGLPEILNGGRNGVLVPNLDSGQFSCEIVKLMDDKVRSNTLGANARHFIENDYSLATAVSLVESTYNELARC